MSKRQKAAAAVDLDALVRSAKERIDSDGSVKISSLGPKSARANVADALRKGGLEVTKTTVRMPLGKQLIDAVERTRHVPLKSIAAFVSGAAAAEARKVAERLVSEGRLVKVIRGSAEVLVSRTEPVCSREEIASLRKTLDALGKALGKVSKERYATLLCRDVLDQLEEMLPAARQTTRTGPAEDGRRGDALSKVFAAMDATRDEAMGLSFVPRVLERLELELGADVARASLLDAAARGLVELRPEGGLNRLTREELEMCLPGPQGTRLSWARRVEGRAS